MSPHCALRAYHQAYQNPDEQPDVELEVVEADPGVKGNTAQGGSKPATLETGAVVQVPLFIQLGEKIKVDTRSHEYLSRAS